MYDAEPIGSLRCSVAAWSAVNAWGGRQRQVSILRTCWQKSNETSEEAPSPQLIQGTWDSASWLHLPSPYVGSGQKLFWNSDTETQELVRGSQVQDLYQVSKLKLKAVSWCALRNHGKHPHMKQKRQVKQLLSISKYKRVCNSKKL